MNPRQTYISVEGAGLEAVNGVYQRVDTVDGVGEYSKIGIYEGQNQEFSLLRCTAIVCGTSAKRWYISIVPMGVRPGTSADIDFYSAPPSETDPDFPPSTGWAKSRKGVGPEPLVRVNRLGKDGKVVEHKLFTVSVLTSVAETYQKMLFSEKFSDIKFVCGDGVTVHAHRNVLAESSPYFDTAFSGPWKENENGEWKTPHPSQVMKTVLTLLYTGKIDNGLVDEDPLAFFNVASEYDLASLKTLAEWSCLRLMNGSNVKEMLQAGHLYDSPALKSACADYVKDNALTLLQSADITTLKSENPDVWHELWKQIELS